VFVRVIRNNVLIGMVVYLHEIAEGNFIIPLNPREYAGEELIGCLGWGPGKPSRARGVIS
jgi:hypothetical protein